jgi:hypothetical protein
MATGFFLILAGIQLHLVESFTMTPRVSHFLNDNFSQQNRIATPELLRDLSTQAAGQQYNSPYYQSSYTRPGGNPLPSTGAVAAIRNPHQSTIGVPRWICWPVLFLGAFLLLQGVTKPRG